MRLKQVFVLAPLLFCAVIASAADSQLKEITVTAQNGATVVTLETAGTFTHNEYRPQPSMVLVDLQKVSSAALKQRQRSLDMPGVKGYRVLEYKSVGGIEVTRLELNVADSAKFQARETANGLQLLFTSGSATASLPAPSTAPATSPRAANAKPSATASVKPAASVSAGSEAVVIHKIDVVRTSAGLAVEIEGAKLARTLRLKDPERLVVDVQNSRAALKQHTIMVNAPDLKSIRVSQYQVNPPVTRVVLDLNTPHNFDVANMGGKLVVTLLPPRAEAQAASPATSAAVTPEVTKPAPTPSVASLALSPQPAGLPMTNQASTEKIAEPVAATPQASQVNAASVASSPSAGEQAKGVPVSSVAPEKAGSAQKSADFVYVEPVFKKQDGTKDNAAAASGAAVSSEVTPAGARAQDAATTVAQNHPPELTTRTQTPEASATPTPQPAQNFAAEQMKENVKPEPQHPPKKYTGEPISVNLKDVDLKDFFRLIHEISGLNIVLDPSVHGTLTLVLDDVPWDQALDVVLQNNGLGRELEGNILRIATLDAFRKQAEEQRLRNEAMALSVSKVTVTRFLSYGRAKELMPNIKKLLSPRGEVLADDRTNALIISDIPSVIPTLDRLLTQLDRKTMQVEIEARVVAATRSFARDLGTQVGFAWGNGSTAVGGNPSTGNSPNTYTSTGFPYFSSPGPSSSPVAQTIPLFSSLPVVNNTSGLNFATAIGNYRVDVLLSAAESHGLAKVLSRPRVVTQNNVTAVVRQGAQVPIVTQSQLGGPATTTYVNAFLRLTVTPQITAENTIFLAVDVENTTPDYSQEVQGNPTLNTQQATTQVLVSDGGTIVIGGVIQTQNSVNVTQVPWLGDIPILGNLFKNRSVSTSTQELIFILSPKIIQT